MSQVLATKLLTAFDLNADIVEFFEADRLVQWRHQQTSQTRVRLPGARYKTAPSGKYIPRVITSMRSALYLFDDAEYKEEWPQHEGGWILRRKGGSITGAIIPGTFPGVKYVFLQRHPRTSEEDFLQGGQAQRFYLAVADRDMHLWGGQTIIELQAIGNGVVNIVNLSELNGGRWDSPLAFNNRPVQNFGFQAWARGVRDLIHTYSGQLACRTFKFASDRSETNNCTRRVGLKVSLNPDVALSYDTFDNVLNNHDPLDNQVADYILKPETTWRGVDSTLFTFHLQYATKAHTRSMWVTGRTIRQFIEQAESGKI